MPPSRTITSNRGSTAGVPASPAIAEVTRGTRLQRHRAQAHGRHRDLRYPAHETGPGLQDNASRVGSPKKMAIALAIVAMLLYCS